MLFVMRGQIFLIALVATLVALGWATDIKELKTNRIGTSFDGSCRWTLDNRSSIDLRVIFSKNRPSQKSRF